MQTTTAHLDAALRAAGGTWTIGPEGTAAIATDPVLADMIAAGLIATHFTTPEQQIAGRTDTYQLTEAGRAWLAATLPQGSVVATDTIATFRIMDGIGFVWRGTDGKRYQDKHIDALLADGATVLRTGKS
ncbi:hypothetical protein Acy02nite_89960 [Actinoplanes cyaneus]|uniref:Uncharacterized protein n=1 Tax=Actinoplanes cyaneus TaxID=52696 RepID=A0A919IRX7_9ACTN|nr:hypothetical protein [Actinoplanes cyaneus]MCW2144345.1 hypothetical protein [Actinoplanes cyaneus]GID71115.1 hypothetical protein Acy02nite_89960 [Actinoplanes cyaneus]